MAVDRLSLLKERLGHGWSFQVDWLGAQKTWTVRAWNPATESRFTRIEKINEDLDQACRELLESVKAFKKGGWAEMADAMKEALEEVDG